MTQLKWITRQRHNTHHRRMPRIRLTCADFKYIRFAEINPCAHVYAVQKRIEHALEFVYNSMRCTLLSLHGIISYLEKKSSPIVGCELEVSTLAPPEMSHKGWCAILDICYLVCCSKFDKYLKERPNVKRLSWLQSAVFVYTKK